MNEKLITKFVIGPVNVTLTNLSLSIIRPITAPGAMNLKDIIGRTEIAVTIRPQICALNFS